MVSRIFSLRDELKKFVGAFEPSVYPGPDAAVLVAVFAYLFLAERPSPRDWIGITLVGAGVVVLALKR